MLQGVNFPKIEPFEPLVVKFTSLWYSSDMGKQWQENTVFHTYYLQLKRDIEAIHYMTPNTLHMFKPFLKFHTDKHFIYITVLGDKHKEVLESYYKCIEEDLEEISKEWPVELLILVDPT
jgi:hypothetical protein